MRLTLSKTPRTHNEHLRHELGWMTVERRTEVARMTLMHTCAPKRIHDRRIQSIKPKNGGECSFSPRANTDAYKECFTLRGIQAWNTLPSHIRVITSTSAFFKQIRAIM